MAIRLRLAFDTVEAFVQGFWRAVEPGTIFLATNKPKEIGTLVRFELTTRNGERLLAGEGRVLVSTSEGTGAGMKLKLTKLSPEGRELVERMLALPGRSTGATRDSTGKTPSVPTGQTVDLDGHELELLRQKTPVPPPPPGRNALPEATVGAPGMRARPVPPSSGAGSGAIGSGNPAIPPPPGAGRSSDWRTTTPQPDLSASPQPMVIPPPPKASPRRPLQPMVEPRRERRSPPTSPPLSLLRTPTPRPPLPMPNEAELEATIAALIARDSQRDVVSAPTPATEHGSKSQVPTPPPATPLVTGADQRTADVPAELPSSTVTQVAQGFSETNRVSHEPLPPDRSGPVPLLHPTVAGSTLPASTGQDGRSPESVPNASEPATWTQSEEGRPLLDRPEGSAPTQESTWTRFKSWLGLGQTRQVTTRPVIPTLASLDELLRTSASPPGQDPMARNPESTGEALSLLPEEALEQIPHLPEEALLSP